MTDSKKIQSLTNFLQETKLEDYLNDKEVADHVEKIQARVQQLKGSSGSTPSGSEDLSGAIRIKLVVVGDGAVGKTSLLIRASTGSFPTEYLPTVFENYTMQLKSHNELILLHLWDTAGQEEYDRLRPLSYPKSDVILLCFSTISQVSFEAVKNKWWPEVHHYIPNIPYILVGTKIDLRESNTPDAHTGKVNPVTPEQGQALAKEIGCAKYMEICSKDGRGIKEVFDDAIYQVLAARGLLKGSDGSALDSKKKQKEKKGGCVML